MTKIDVITKYFHPVKGGIETSIKETYSLLDPEHYKIVVHTSRDTYGEKNNLPIIDEIKNIDIRRYKSGIFGFWPKINWKNADIVALHNFNLFPHSLILLFVLMLKIFKRKNFNLVLTPHGGFTPSWNFFSAPVRIIKRIIHYTLGLFLINSVVDKVRAVSGWEKDEMVRMGIDIDMIEIIPSGIENGAFEDSESQVSKEVKEQVKSLGRYLIQVGRIYPNKNYETSIRALEHLPSDIKLVIIGKIGDYDYREKLDEIINSLNLVDRVIFIDMVETSTKYYLIKNAIVLVHMAWWESYATVVREAMAQGKVCIVSKMAVLPKLIQTDVNGFSVATRDYKQLAAKIDYILNPENFEKKQEMEKNNIKKAQENRWKTVSKNMTLLFQGLEKPEAETTQRKIIIKPFLREFSISEKKIFITVIILSLFILILGVRGYAGTPSIAELNTEKWVEYGPLELSPERGKYALMYSLVEDHSLTFSPDVARFTTPDVAINDRGEYVSLFPPGVSLLLVPGYILGRIVGLGQIGASMVIILFAIINIILIRSIAIRLGANNIAASLGSLVYLFATPAFAYAASIYQHHITTFFILLSVYIILRWNNFWSIASIFFICAFSIIVDNPNLFLLFPIGLVAVFRIINIKLKDRQMWLNFRPIGALGMLLIIPPLLFFGWYNAEANTSPFKLSGTLEGVNEIDSQGNPVDIHDTEEAELRQSTDKEAWNFFETRNLLEGFYVFTISPDRGVIWYAPVILFGFLGLYYLYKRKPKAANLLLGIIGLNFLLYSMWGDPRGGWAFGPRYMIPAFSLLAVGIGIALTKIRRNYVLSILFIFVLCFSVWVNTLGAITSSANPPETEVLTLEEQTGKEQKYTYERNIQYMEEHGLKSFVYNSGLNKAIEPKIYHYFITILILLTSISLFFLIPEKWRNYYAKRNEKN